MTEIVAFTGKARHGKDTAAQVLIEERGFVREGFADPLKEVVAIAFNLTPAHFEAPLKETPLDRWPFQSPREILQCVGTEMFREHYPGVWVHNLERRTMRHEKTVVTDLRFLDEEGAIRALKGKILRVVKLGASDKIRQHSSETEQDQIEADETISVPAGAIAELQDAIRDRFPC